jgi:diguanylate cyclase (GGDEF)-like protein
MGCNLKSKLFKGIFKFYKSDGTIIKDLGVTIENNLNESSMVLDTATIIKDTHAISGEIKLEELLKKLVYILLENAGAQKVCYLVKKEEIYIIQAEGNVQENQVDVMKEINLENTENLPKKIIYYVEHSRDSIILDDASVSEKYINDPYIIDKKPKSVMCIPVLSKGNLLGILYLENSLIEGAFNNERIEIIKIISSQLAISLENATLYTNLEHSEKQLREHHDQLEELVEKRTVKLKEEIMERKKAEKLLEEMATHDNLTGLANRKLFQSQLNYSLESAKVNKLFLAILFIDLDGFKTINDTLGHDNGDIVLKTVAERLLKAVRTFDIVSRFGGDEFVIIMKNLKNTDAIDYVCEKIINDVGTPIVLGENNCHVTASIGVAVFPHDGDDMDNLIKKADNAMYVAKKSGKNKVIFS